jgi:uncharacterized membrane protein YbhN (UPF0104 family)
MYRLRKKSWLMAFGKVGVSAGLLGLLLYKVDVHELAENLRKLTPTFILFAWLFYAFCQLLSSFRWQLFLTVKGIHVPLSRLFSFYLMGMFLNNFLPGAVGGDVAKSYYLYRDTGQGKYAVISVILERFTGLLGLSVLSIGALAIGFHYLESPLVLAAVGGTALFLFAVALMIWWDPLYRPLLCLVGRLFPRRIVDRVQQLYTALASYKDHHTILIMAVVLSVGIQGLYAVFYAMIGYGLGTPIPVMYFILFLPLVTLVTMVPITVGGLGIREALMIVLFREVGVSSVDILAVSLTGYLLNTLLSLSGAVLLALYRKPVILPSEVSGDA